jgi:hypothetical protein
MHKQPSDTSYGDRIDRHIYGIKNGADCPAEWFDVAMAAFDKCGISVEGLDKIKDLASEIAIEEGID